MRLTQEEKEYLSLIKEQNAHMKNATRPGAPKVEVDYYMKMATRTASSIRPPKKTNKERREENE
jgi:hypothetical protein